MSTNKKTDLRLDSQPQVRGRGELRGGLSALEFVGCMIAVIGGAWLGALYLGVDMKKVAYTALAQSDMLEKVPESWRPAAPADTSVTREQLVNTLREELGSLKSEISALRTDNNKTGSALPATADVPDSNGAIHDKTIAYWSRLNEIALGEAGLQQEAEAAFNSENAAKVFAIKGRLCKFAAKAVEAIPTKGVDATAVEFGQYLSVWYNHGAALYENAVTIWESPAGPQARLGLNDEWKQSELHYHNEARLLQDKAAATRGTLSRLYGDKFPEFARPAGRPGETENHENAG